MYRNAFGEDSERLFSAEFAVQIFMDLSLCSAGSSSNSCRASSSTLRLRKRLPKAIVYLVAGLFVLKFVLLLFVKIHDSLGRGNQDFF